MHSGPFYMHAHIHTHTLLYKWQVEFCMHGWASWLQQRLLGDSRGELTLGKQIDHRRANLAWNSIWPATLHHWEPVGGWDTPSYPRMLKPLSASSERVLPYHVIRNHTGPHVDAPLLNRGFLDQGFSDPDDLSLQFVASSCAAQLIWVCICCAWQ